MSTLDHFIDTLWFLKAWSNFSSSNSLSEAEMITENEESEPK